MKEFDVTYCGYGFRNFYAPELNNPEICEVYDLIGNDLVCELEEQVITAEDFEIDENAFDTWEEYMDDLLVRNDLF